MSLRTASIQLAYTTNDALRLHLLRILTADVPAGEEEPAKGKGQGGPPPMWKEFLDAVYEGGKRKVPNTNFKTREKHPQVAVSTLLKSDKTFYGKVYKEYLEWKSKQKDPDAKGGPKKSPKKEDESEDKGDKEEEGKKPATKEDTAAAIDKFQEMLKDNGSPSWSHYSPEGAKLLKQYFSLKDEIKKAGDDFDHAGAITKLEKLAPALGKAVAEAKAKKEEPKKEEPKKEEPKPATKKDTEAAAYEFYKMVESHGNPEPMYFSTEGKKIWDEWATLADELEEAGADYDHTAAMAKLKKLAPVLGDAVAEAGKAQIAALTKKSKPGGTSKPKAPKLQNAPSSWDEYGEKEGAVRESWTQKESDAVKVYTSNDYVHINRSLREGSSYGMSAETKEKVEATTRKLDALFADPKKSRVKHPVTVARGVKSDHPLVKMLEAGSLEVGMEYKDPGYVSTTIKPAPDFPGYHVYISVHAGAKGVYVGPPPIKDGYSKFPNEYEMLLNRGTNLRVTGMDKDTGIIHAEIIDED